MATLPELKPGQSWCCGDAGTGPTTPIPVSFEYSRIVHPNGDGESMWERQFACKCCGGSLLLWDEGKQDFLDWDYLEHATQEADQQTAQEAPSQSPDQGRNGGAA
jgi:hypothetical protein